MDSSVDRLLAEAEVAAELGQFSRAVESLERAITIRGEDAQLWMLLGQRYAQADRLEAARTALERAIRLAPTVAVAHSVLGTVLSDLGLYAEAEAALQAATALKPSAARFVLLGSVQASLNKRAEAISSFEAALALQPNDDEALYNLAVALMVTDRPRALRLLERAYALAPDNAEVVTQLGFLYLGEERLDEAEVMIDRAIDLDPVAWRPRVYMGNLQWRRGRITDARLQFEHGCALGSTDTEPYLAAAAYFEAQDSPQQAERMYRSALEVAPEDGLAAVRYARFLIERGRRDEGRAVVGSLLAADPRNVDLAELIDEYRL